MTKNQETFNDLFNKAKQTKQYTFAFQGIEITIRKDTDRDIAWLKMRTAMAKSWNEIFC